MTRRVRRPVTLGTTTKNTDKATIPAPTMGLNSVDNLVSMPPTCALTLTNFIVRPFGCEVRKGFVNYATNILDEVETLLVYNSTATTGSKMFACAGSKIFNVTDTTIAPEAVVTGLTNAQWESVNFATPGGKFLVAVNGNDASYLYDGSTWTPFTTVTSPLGPGQISGCDASTWTNVTHFKLRIWAVERSSTRAWYLPINSVGGAAVQFDFGPYLKKGGSIVALTSWSIDAGTGNDDLLVAVSSEGEILIYEGTDPSSSTTWKLVGVWEVAAPLGKRCFTKEGGDVLYLSSDGMTPLSKYLQSAGIDVSTRVTVPIQQMITDAAKEGGSLFGWQMTHYLDENVILLNVPATTGNTQFVYNTITRAWSQFVGWEALCFAQFKGKLYFGGRGVVARCFEGYRDAADANGSAGSMYQAKAQQAFNYFEKPGVKKHFKMVRITATSLVSPTIMSGILPDFEFGVNPMLTKQVGQSVSAFNSALWNNAVWGRNTATIKQWSTVQGIGYAASLVLVINVSGQTTWASSDWLFEVGGVL